MKLIDEIKVKAKALKKDVLALYLAYKRPEVPLIAKILAIIVVGYALSPVDLIPDFIPVLGYLDDLILVPLGVLMVIRLVPVDVMEQCRKDAEEIFRNGKPRNLIAGAIIISIWVLVLGLISLKLVIPYLI